MSEIRKWLEAIGLAEYAEAFDTNAIRQVDDQILKDIGVSAAGHRMRIRALPSSNGRPDSDAMIPTTSGSISSRRYSLREPMISARPFLCWRTCCQFNVAFDCSGTLGVNEQFFGGI
jgi:hypothetical protein